MQSKALHAFLMHRTGFGKSHHECAGSQPVAGPKGLDTLTNSTVKSGRVRTSFCMCHRLTTQLLLHSSLVPVGLVGFRLSYDSAAELGDVSWPLKMTKYPAQWS